MLLLHGFDSSVLEYRRLLPLLRDRFQIWALDLLGFGFTERLPGLRFDAAAIQAHLDAFWQSQIDEPVVLVGASMGGAAAIRFALARPESVRALVLIDSAGIAPGPAIAKLLLPPLDYLAAEFLRRPRVREGICKAAYCDKRLVTEDTKLCAALHLALPGWHRALSSFAKSGGFPSIAPQLGQLATPALILWGDSDRILGTKDAEVFASGIPGSKLVWVERSGHVPHVEAAATVANEILSFCGD